MEEKKIVFKSIDEQLAEEERKTASVSRSSEKTDVKSHDKAVSKASAGSNGPKRGRKKLRLKKSVRRTIGSLMLATSIVIGAIPMGGVSAGTTGPGSQKKVSDFTISATGVQNDLAVPTEGPYYGGFPLVKPEETSPGVYKKTEIGGPGHEYYVVTGGYNGQERTRPVYALNSSATDIEGYFETNGTEDVYTPLGGELNLSIGYIKDTTTSTDWVDMDVSKWWSYNGQLYKPQLKKFELKTKDNVSYTLYGKRIAVYNKIEVLEHRVSFVNEDLVEVGHTTVEHGKYVDKSKIPPFPLPKQSTGTNPEWQPNPAYTAIEEDDFVFKVHYQYPSEKTTRTELINPSETETSEGVHNGESNQEGNNDAEADSENPSGQQGNAVSNPDDNVENPSNDETSSRDNAETQTEGETMTSETDVELPHEDAGGFGLTGVMLQWYPDHNPRQSEDVEYHDDPVQYYYVCDEYAAVSNIRNNVFKDTTNIDSVELPKNLMTLGNNSFKGSYVDTVKFGSGFTTIGASAFEDSMITKVYYSPNSSLRTIGSRAFANSGLNIFTVEGGEGFKMAPTVNKIGDAAFLGAHMSEVDFSGVNSPCAVGNCAFAKCMSLENVNLAYNDGTKNPISNLNTVTGLFCEDEALKSAVMPHGLSTAYTLTEGTFGTCPKLSYIEFPDGKGTFSDKEFDNAKMTVKGPKPTKGDSYDLDPSGNQSASYTSSMKPDNDYVYRYQEDASKPIHECTNVLGYIPHTDAFFKTKPATGTQKFIFDIDESDFTLFKAFDRTPTTRADLEIGNKIGPRLDDTGNIGDIPVVNIGDSTFEGNQSIQYLQLNANLDKIGKSAFKGTKIVQLWAYVDNTQFLDDSFCDNDFLERATFAYGGPSGSKLYSNSFGNCKALKNVDFYDDNLDTGKKEEYAQFIGKDSIASNAFFYSGRTEADKFTFKGPMEKNFGPYEFAIDPTSRISDQNIFTIYYSGNPWNLTAQYIPNPFARQYVNVDDPKDTDNAKDPTTKIATKKFVNDVGSDRFTKYNPTTKKYEPVDGGVCLLKYPNMLSNVMYDDIEHALTPRDKTKPEYKVDTPQKIEEDIPSTARTQMQDDCVTYTRNIEIPYGIDYIDLAKTYRNGATDVKYKVFDDSVNLYKEVENPYYEIFKYNPDIYSVKFIEGGVHDFPDRMFEGAQNLMTVTFETDVENIGYLPFYVPDTEADSSRFANYKPASFPHLGPGVQATGDLENKSHLKSVVFSGEGSAASEDNKKYYTTVDSKGQFTGIIKGDDGDRVQVAQIVPSRGDLCGDVEISKEELADVDNYVPYAARDCDAIKTVLFPDDGCSIAYGCFMDCDRLKNVTMPQQFMTICDQAFARISAGMDVTFPYDLVRPDDLPFESGSADGLTMPDVIFHVHNTKEAEPLRDYADKEDNIDYVLIPDAITLTYRDRYDDTYFQTVTGEANGATFGMSYPPKVIPTYEGKEPSTWTGIDKNGKPVDWKTDPLTTDTTFTSKYGDTDEKVKLFFIDYNGDPIKTVQLTKGSVLTSDKMPKVPEHAGMKFLYWSPDLEGEEIDEDATITAKYDTPTPTPTPTTTPGPTTTPSPSSSSTSKSSSSSSKSSSSSSSSSSAYPVYVSSQDAGMSGPISSAGINSTVYIDEGNGGGSGSGSGSGSGKKGGGNASVISTTGGITDTGKISATVNGSSDNYVVKITQTQEADEMGVAALHNAYGDDITPFRYLCFDISLYDSTGTNKISPVPEGVSVSITMPIPDDLAIYGGNAKIASTAGGVLEKMTPRFTVINGVPCMTYTCTHFSPYMVYVDTNNLTEAGISDMTPKTADGIHPKWFLCFGLAAMAVVMFLKKDPEEYLKKKAA